MMCASVVFPSPGGSGQQYVIKGFASFDRRLDVDAQILFRF
jgi:hypothetical protein